MGGGRRQWWKALFSNKFKFNDEKEQTIVHNLTKVELERAFLTCRRGGLVGDAQQHQVEVHEAGGGDADGRHQVAHSGEGERS